MTVTPITEDEVSQMVMKVKKEKKEKKQRKKKAVLAEAPAPTTDEAVVVVKPKRTLPPALKEWTLYHTAWYARHSEAIKGIGLVDRTRLAGLAYRLEKKKPRATDPETTPFP